MHMYDMTKELQLKKPMVIDHIANLFMHHNIKFMEFLYVNGQGNFLPMPCQPTLGFNIVPYGTTSQSQKILS